jgi:hypothetical protein
MICYKDMTFCPFHERCSEGATCRRALTPGVTDGAKRAGVGIASFSVEPDCLSQKASEQ